MSVFWEVFLPLIAVDVAILAGMYFVVRRPLEKQLREMIRTLDRHRSL